MSNQATIDAANAKVNDLENAFERYDALTEQRKQLAADLAATQKLADDVLADESLSHDDATAKLMVARAKLDVLQVRLQSVDTKLATQSKLTLETGRIAQSAANDVLYALRESRLARARKLLTDNFEFPGYLGISVDAVAATSRSVGELVNLGSAYDYRPGASDNDNLEHLHKVKGAFASLRAIVATEPELAHEPSPPLSVVARAA